MHNDISNQYQISEDQLDRLEILLEDPVFEDGTMRLDEIQGFLCAALSGPAPMPEEDWMVEILGSEEILETETGREVADILRRFALALEAGLEAGEPPVLLLYPKEEDDDSSDYLSWAQAYLSGVDAAEVDWFEYLGEVQDSEEVEEISYLDERLFSLMVLSGDAQAAALEHHEEWPEGEELKTLENECQEELSHVILDIYKFWSALRNTSGFIEESTQSETADDCPCGSGKKFGQCCGIN